MNRPEGSDIFPERIMPVGQCAKFGEFERAVVPWSTCLKSNETCGPDPVDEGPQHVDADTKVVMGIFGIKRGSIVLDRREPFV